MMPYREPIINVEDQYLKQVKFQLLESGKASTEGTVEIISNSSGEARAFICSAVSGTASNCDD